VFQVRNVIVSIPTAAGVTASSNRHARGDIRVVSIPTAAGVTASYGYAVEVIQTKSQFPLLQGLLHPPHGVGWIRTDGLVSIPTAAGVTASVFRSFFLMLLFAQVSIPTAAGVTASQKMVIVGLLCRLNSHCCRGYCIRSCELVFKEFRVVSIPTAAGVTASTPWCGVDSD